MCFVCVNQVYNFWGAWVDKNRKIQHFPNNGKNTRLNIATSSWSDFIRRPSDTSFGRQKSTLLTLTGWRTSPMTPRPVKVDEHEMWCAILPNHDVDISYIARVGLMKLDQSFFEVLRFSSAPTGRLLYRRVDLPCRPMSSKPSDKYPFRHISRELLSNSNAQT